MTGMLWVPSGRADRRSRLLADRHYSRQTVGARQFVPPGRCLVLYAKTAAGQAYWVTSWPFPQYVKHQWPGAWICSAFRNEGAALSSELIRTAVACTRYHFGDPPEMGMVTFVDPMKIRRKRDPGRCFIKAGFVRSTRGTKSRLIALQLESEAMPRPASPLTEMEVSS
jgi:hypothetical protein